MNAPPALHVACAADARYVRHSAAMIHSVLVAGGVQATIDYLHGPDIGPGDRDRLAAMVDRLGGAIAFHEIAPERVAGLPGMGRITTTMWYRIWLPELLAGVDRALYLDIDAFVLDSLAPLAELDLAGDVLAAVANLWEPWNRGRPSGLGIPDGQPYFNSGVLLMNLDAMRANATTEAVLGYVRDHPDTLVWPDQDALNVVLGADTRMLAPRWNAMNSVMLFDDAPEVFGAEAAAEARERPAIRHFEGPAINKPWNVLAPADARALYRRHRRGTPWPRYVPEGMTPRTLASRAVGQLAHRR